MPGLTKRLSAAFGTLEQIHITKLRNAIEEMGWDKLSSTDVAYLIGKVAGDGNLDKAYTLHFVGEKRCIKELKNFLIATANIPENKVSMRKKNWLNGTSYLLQINIAAFGRFLYAFGATRGNKMCNNFRVPNWIFSSEDS